MNYNLSDIASVLVRGSDIWSNNKLDVCNPYKQNTEFNRLKNSERARELSLTTIKHVDPVKVDGHH
jgi:hypothetical protein